MNITVESAPSNIALVKYMGKSDSKINRASNSSLSYTLDYLKSEVAVVQVNPLLMNKFSSLLQGGEDLWIPWSEFKKSINEVKNSNLISNQASYDILLSENGKQKFMKHWYKCRSIFAPQYKGQFIISSINHFPSDCGLASSASSFAALTKAAYANFRDLDVLEKNINISELAMVSREGSGSSCRSFFSPFVVWRDQEVFKLDTTFKNLHHIVVIVDDQKKEVSSSDAHQKVQSSLLYEDRTLRAEKRTNQLIEALQSLNWKQIFDLTWADFWDMHCLFETSNPPFYYMLPESLEVLRWVQDEWKKNNDGPIATMDAGANVHLLYRPNQMQNALEHYRFLSQKYKLYSNV